MHWGAGTHTLATRLWPLVVLQACTSAFVMPMQPARSLPHGWRMQLESPTRVVVPDTLPPQFANPTKLVSGKAGEKAKKYKVLLFNDNVNRCAWRTPHPTSLSADTYQDPNDHDCD